MDYMALVALHNLSYRPQRLLPNIPLVAFHRQRIHRTSDRPPHYHPDSNQGIALQDHISRHTFAHKFNPMDQLLSEGIESMLFILHRLMSLPRHIA